GRDDDDRLVVAHTGREERHHVVDELGRALVEVDHVVVGRGRRVVDVQRQGGTPIAGTARLATAADRFPNGRDLNHGQGSAEFGAKFSRSWPHRAGDGDPARSSAQCSLRGSLWPAYRPW